MTMISSLEWVSLSILIHNMIVLKSDGTRIGKNELRLESKDHSDLQWLGEAPREQREFINF